MSHKDLLKKVKHIQLVTQKKMSTAFMGEYDSAFHGQGLEFQEVREYFPGDDVRTIDWNVTARAGHPHVKTFREERELQVYLLIDLSASGDVSYDHRSKKNVMAEIAALLTTVAQGNNDRVGLILFSDQIELHIPPQKGRSHCNRIIREILQFSPQSKATDLNPPLQTLFKWTKKNSIIFLLSDFYARGFEKNLTLLAQKHDIVTLLIKSPIETQLPTGYLLPLRDPETKEKILWDTPREGHSWESSGELFSFFRKKGIDWITLEPGEDYFHKISQFFLKRERLPHG